MQEKNYAWMNASVRSVKAKTKKEAEKYAGYARDIMLGRIPTAVPVRQRTSTSQQKGQR